MDTSEIMRIVRDENLDTPVLYGAGHLYDDAVVLERDGEVWKAYIADERGGAIETTVQTFDNESDALDYVLIKLRGLVRARRAMDEMRARL